jgi:hypothetical protein
MQDELQKRFRKNVAVAAWRRPPAPGGAPAVGMDGPWAEANRVFLELARRFEREHAQRYAAIRSAEQVRARAAAARRMLRRVAGLRRPIQRAPLKPVVTEGRGGAGYRLQRVLFQSRPGLFVTGNMYLPVSAGGPYPALLYLCGHSLNGKGYADYRATCVELARNGFAVFIFDPAGQGERDEYADAATGRRTVARACRQHGAIGDPMYLAGGNFAALRLHDAMRAVDYLRGRGDVLAARIGALGKSGGGWEALWLAALDRRICAASSGNYFTSFRRRMENRGADAEPDPEQDPFGILALGLEAADLLVACYPRPVLVCSTTRDFFPLDGARASFKLARRLYAIGGYGDRLAHRWVAGGHEFPAALRQMTCAWLKKWVAGAADGILAEAAVQLPPERDTWVTKRGFVLGELGGISAPEVAARQAREMLLRRAGGPASWRADRLARRLRGLAPAEAMPLVTKLAGVTRQAATITAAGIWIGGEVWRTAEGVRLAVRISRPAKARGGILLCAQGERDGRLAANPLAARLAANGFTVLELQPRAFAPAADTYADFVPLREAVANYNSFLAGRPLLGYRVADIRLGIDALRKLVGRKAFIGIQGEGIGALFGLLAAALDGRIGGVIERRGLTSWASLALNRSYAWPVSVILPGALRDFDLADLRAGLAPRPLAILDPCDHLAQPLAAPEMAREFGAVARAYRRQRAPRSFLVARARRGASAPPIVRLFLDMAAGKELGRN